MLPLRHLLHAAPCLDESPVQICHSSTQSLFSLAYSPPSDLRHITQAVQCILDNAPTVNIRYTYMNGLNADGLDANFQEIWGNDAPSPKGCKPMRTTV